MEHCSGYTRSPGLDSHSLLSSLEALPCLSASEVGPGVPESPEDIEGRARGIPMGLVSSQLGSVSCARCCGFSLAVSLHLAFPVPGSRLSGMAWAIKYLTPSEA